MIVVLDTNVLLSATLWNGSVSQKLLFTLIRKNAKIYSSPAILDEYHHVLTRDFDYTPEEAKDLIKKLLPALTLITPTRNITAVKGDPDDNEIIECAIAAHAETIITYDKHLLKLNGFMGLKILPPEKIISALN